MVDEKGEECRVYVLRKRDSAEWQALAAKSDENAQICIWAVGKFYRLMTDEPSWCACCDVHFVLSDIPQVLHHWDHTQGLPFFAAGDRPRPDRPVHAGPGRRRRSAAPRHVAPALPDHACGAARDLALPRARARRPVPDGGLHGAGPRDPAQGGRTFGFRVSDDSASIAYFSDHCPTALGPGPDGLGEYHEAALALAGDCDLLIHDAQYLDEELPTRASFGHSSPGYVVHLAEPPGPDACSSYHHDPPRTDDDIDAIVASHGRPRSPSPQPSRAWSSTSGRCPHPDPAAVSGQPTGLQCGAMAVRVVLAEDNYLVREGVGTLVETEADLEVVAVCADYDPRWQAVDQERPDVVVTDIRMPPTGTDEGIRAANVLREQPPRHGCGGAEPVLRARLRPRIPRRRVQGPRLSPEGAGLGHRPAGRRHPRGRRGGIGDRPRSGRRPGGGAGQAGRLAAAPPHPREVEILARWPRARTTPPWLPRSCCRSGRWRSTSTRSSPSSRCRRSPTSIAG